MCAYLKPDIVPYEYLGPLGTVTQYLVQSQPRVLAFLFYFAYGLHAVESCVAMHLCRKKDLTASASVKWLLSVMLFGVFSMRHLLSYQPKKLT